MIRRRAPVRRRRPPHRRSSNTATRKERRDVATSTPCEDPPVPSPMWMLAIAGGYRWSGRSVNRLRRRTRSAQRQPTSPVAGGGDRTGPSTTSATWRSSGRGRPPRRSPPQTRSSARAWFRTRRCGRGSTRSWSRPATRPSRRRRLRRRSDAPNEISVPPAFRVELDGGLVRIDEEQDGGPLGSIGPAGGHHRPVSSDGPDPGRRRWCTRATSRRRCRRAGTRRGRATSSRCASGSRS